MNRLRCVQVKFWKKGNIRSISRDVDKNRMLGHMLRVATKQASRKPHVIPKRRNAKLILAIVLPGKKVKRIKLKRSDASSVRFGGDDHEKQILQAETIHMGDMTVLLVEKTPSKVAGFIHPLAKTSLKNDFIPFKEENFDCHSNDHCFLRTSHDDNSKVPVGKVANNCAMCNRTAILREPSEDMLGVDGLSLREN